MGTFLELKQIIDFFIQLAAERERREGDNCMRESRNEKSGLFRQKRKECVIEKSF